MCSMSPSYVFLIWCIIYIKPIQASWQLMVTSKQCDIVHRQIYLNVTYTIKNAPKSFSPETISIQANPINFNSYNWTTICENILATQDGHYTQQVRCKLLDIVDLEMYSLRLLVKSNATLVGTTLLYPLYYAVEQAFHCFSHKLRHLLMSPSYNSVSVQWKYPHLDMYYYVLKSFLLVMEDNKVTKKVSCGYSLNNRTNHCTLTNLLSCKRYYVCVLTLYNVASEKKVCQSVTTNCEHNEEV